MAEPPTTNYRLTQFVRRKFPISLSTIKAQGAIAAGQIAIAGSFMPKRSTVFDWAINVTQAFDGPGFSTFTCTLISSGIGSYDSVEFDTGDEFTSAYKNDGNTIKFPKVENADITLSLDYDLTGCNCNQLTAGAIDIWFLYLAPP